MRSVFITSIGEFAKEGDQMNNHPNRKKLRLEAYDYASSGYYFITICNKRKQHLFGKIVGNGLDRSELHLSDLGKLAEQQLLAIPNHFCGVSIDQYVIMPNHIHVIFILNPTACTERSRPFPTVSTIVGLYKSGVSRVAGFSVWQSSFHDHIIRNQQDYTEIASYIANNPRKWLMDRYHI